MSPKKYFKVTRGAKIRLAILLVILIIFAIWSYLAMSAPLSPEQANAQAKLLQTIYYGGNYIEAVIWGIFALGFMIRAVITSGLVRNQAIMAAIVFFLFGLSDLVEVHTGAWWHPWWLFIWKGACVLSMIYLLILYIRTQQTTPGK